MKLNKKIIIPVIIVMVVILTVFFFLRNKSNAQTTFTFAEITRGDIENTVNATGTIEPVTTVEVGTQVSGIINEIFVDFNDKVTRNQLMAVIDTTILSVQVRDARASLLRSQAQFDQQKYNYERTEKLFKQELLSELEYITAKSNFQSAQSSLLSSQNSLEKAERNMRYAFIRSPINGTVIYREVEEGQTVASSFQTPRLFLIAEDLSNMEIHALVDESEIGLITVGQDVVFEVQAHDNKQFTGTVRQVWLQPETVQNVVNYTVVIDADNPDGLLLPGMTATIDFIVELKKDVLLAPVAATRLQPTPSMFKSMMEAMQKRFGNNPDSSNTNGAAQRRPGAGMGMGMPGMGFGNGNGNGGQSNFAMLWYVDDHNNPQMVPVRTGSNDGKNIEIIPFIPNSVESGMKVIDSIETTEEMDSGNGFPRPPGGGFGRRPF